jgi:hypothetical protein
MTTYAFRITAKLAEGGLEPKEREFPFVLPRLGRPIMASLSKQESENGSRVLTLWCGGFNSEDEAREAGGPVKTALMLAGVLLYFGIDVGGDDVVSPAAKRKDGQPDDRLQPDVHGLQVVPEIEGMIFGFLRMGRSVRDTISPSDFEKKVAECYRPGKQLTKKQTLSAQLFNQSHFHASDAARFITLISAVEALAEQSHSSPAACVLIEDSLRMAGAAVGLEEEEQEALKQGLSNLKRESIGSACRALVRTHCGEPEVKDFKRLYNIRSTLLHDGEPPSGTRFDVELCVLDPLVRLLIARHVAASWRT